MALADATTEQTDVETSTLDGSTASRLIAAAAGLFRRKGYHATSTRELAAILGINKATLYHHIRGKEDLLYQVCVECLERIHTSVARAIAGEAQPLPKLQTLIQVHVTTMLNDRDKHATMLLELKALTGERAAEVIRLRDHYEAMLRAVIQGAQEQGAIRKDIEAKYLTLSLLNLMNWTIFWFEPSHVLSPSAIAEILADVYLQGTGVHEP